MKSVSVASIITDLEHQKEEVTKDRAMTLEQRVKLTNAIIDRQLRAAMLDLQFRRSAARLPAQEAGLTTMLAAPAEAS